MDRSARRLLLGSALLLSACPRNSPPTPPDSMPTTTEPAEATPSPPTVPEGPLRYRGEAKRPLGAPLPFYAELLPGSDSYRGTVTVPSQGIFDAALDEIVVADGQLAFSLNRIGARWSADVDPQGQTSECRLEQGGATLLCTLEAVELAVIDAVRQPVRPQTPEPPFPYQTEPAKYGNPADGVRLAGDLTIPAGPGPHPAALLISGSGPQDRDGTLLEHKTLWVLADDLTRRGVAVLRVDDRGVGESTGTLSQSTEDDLARDVAAGVSYLRRHPSIDPDRVGLIGHSEGGILGPRVAAGDPTIAFVVMMAGTGVPGYEVLREQSAAILRANGAPETTIAIVQHQQAKALQIVLDNEDPEEARAKLTQMLGTHPQVETMVSPWFRSFIRYDPAPALEQLRCPVLVLNGELDMQVLPKQNLPAIVKALNRNRRRTTVHQLPGLNHLFQPAKTGSPEEYGTIEQTIAPEVLTIIGEWVVEQTSNAAKSGGNNGRKIKNAKKTKSSARPRKPNKAG